MSASARATGPVSPASPSRSALSSAALSSGLQHPGRVGHARLPQQFGRLDDKRDQVVGPAGQRRVVERPVLLLDEDGLASHLDDQRLCDQAQLIGRGDAEGDPGQPVQVVRTAGEGHDRVQGQWQGATAGRGAEHPGTVPATRVREQAALQRGAGRGQPGDETGQRVIGHRKQDQVGGGENGGRPLARDAGQHPVGPLDRGIGHGGDGHDVVTGPGERGAEDRTDPAGPDDAYPEASGMRRARLVHRVSVRR